MFLKKVDGPRSVTLPDGSIMTHADLPPASTRRWVASRKAAVVQGVVYGLLSQSDALSRYSLSEEEFEIWCGAVIAVTGLRRYARNICKVTVSSMQPKVV
jgi:hypothetical protein